MKLKNVIHSKWVFPVLTACIILTAIVLPERLSTFQDRRLFGAAHVEVFDSTLGLSSPNLTMTQRINMMGQLLFGEVTDAYSRLQDNFTEEELTQIDKLSLTAIQDLVSNGVIDLPKGVSTDTLELYGCMKYLIWDRVTAGEASFIESDYYDDRTNCGVSLLVDEESAMAVQFTVYFPEIEAAYNGTNGVKLMDTLCLFANQFGAEVSETKFDRHNAYLTLQTEDGEVYYHAGQKYETLTIEMVPSSSVYTAMKLEAESISVDSSQQISDRS